jgi:hypothetical protein
MRASWLARVRNTPFGTARHDTKLTISAAIQTAVLVSNRNDHRSAFVS